MALEEVAEVVSEVKQAKEKIEETEVASEAAEREVTGHIIRVIGQVIDKIIDLEKKVPNKFRNRKLLQSKLRRPCIKRLLDSMTLTGVDSVSERKQSNMQT